MNDSGHRTEPRRVLARWYHAASARLDRLFHRALREIRVRAQDVPRAVAIFLILSFMIVFAASWAFVAVAASVLEGDTDRFDEAVLLWIHRFASPWLDRVAIEVTTLGDGIVIAMIILIASALLWVTDHRYSVLLLWVAVGGSLVLVEVLKFAFNRPRPLVFEWRTEYAIGSSSFPSGHAMGSVVTYATLAYLISRLQATRRVRRITLAIGALTIGAIGLSRLYLGVHYPSDVFAGYAIGLAWATLCALGIEALRYFQTGRLRPAPNRPPEPGHGQPPEPRHDRGPGP